MNTDVTFKLKASALNTRIQVTREDEKKPHYSALLCVHTRHRLNGLEWTADLDLLQQCPEQSAQSMAVVMK